MAGSAQSYHRTEEDTWTRHDRDALEPRYAQRARVSKRGPRRQRARADVYRHVCEHVTRNCKSSVASIKDADARATQTRTSTICLARDAWTHRDTQIHAQIQAQTRTDSHTCRLDAQHTNHTKDNNRKRHQDTCTSTLRSCHAMTTTTSHS